MSTDDAISKTRSDCVVLITGATSGIGLGLAQRYARIGATVIVTGRSGQRLEQACSRIPGSVPAAGDLAAEGDRVRLAEQVQSWFGQLDVLVNNAGIQRRVAIAADSGHWPQRQAELDLLLAAPMHLVDLFTPMLLASPGAAQIVNVTSGGAFNPQPFAPAYSAAKAALHSYTMNLQYAFTRTAVAVTELIPPAVATGLAGPGQAHGADLDEFCDAVFPRILNHDPHVGFGPTDTPEFRQRLTVELERFASAVDRFPVHTYSPNARAI